MARILGVDPGFANFGVVGLEFDGKRSKIIYTDLIRTAPARVKQRLRRTDDKQRRHSEIRVRLREAIDEVQPTIAALEAVSFVRNAAVMCDIGGSWYGLYYLLQDAGIYTVGYNPAELKQALTGKKTASKQDMMDRASKLWPKQIPWSKWPKSKHEHIGDAIAAAWAAINDPAIPWSILKDKEK